MKLFNDLCELIASQGWAATVDSSRHIALIEVAGKKASYACVFFAEEELSCLLLYTDVINRVPEIKRLRMSDFLARANCGLVLGNFELSPENGEVYFRISLPVRGTSLTKEQVSDMISASVYTIERYYPGMNQLIYRNVTAQEAIDLCEHASEAIKHN